LDVGRWTKRVQSPKPKNEKSKVGLAIVVILTLDIGHWTLAKWVQRPRSDWLDSRHSDLGHWTLDVGLSESESIRVGRGCRQGWRPARCRRCVGGYHCQHTADSPGRSHARSLHEKPAM